MKNTHYHPVNLKDLGGHLKIGITCEIPTLVVENAKRYLSTLVSYTTRPSENTGWTVFDPTKNCKEDVR